MIQGLTPPESPLATRDLSHFGGADLAQIIAATEAAGDDATDVIVVVDTDPRANSIWRQQLRQRRSVATGHGGVPGPQALFHCMHGALLGNVNGTCCSRTMRRVNARPPPVQNPSARPLARRCHRCRWARLAARARQALASGAPAQTG